MPNISSQQLMADGVYFYVPTLPQDPQKLCYAADCLAAGLHRLGVPVFCNVETPYGRQKPLGQMGPHLYVMDVTQKNYSPVLMEAFENFDSRRKVVLSMSDTTSTTFTPDGIPALMTHENKFRRVRGRRIPWAFGLSQRILEETEHVLPFEQREQAILHNFRPSFNQDVRASVDLMLLGHLEKHFTLDHEFCSNHLDRLTRYTGCLAYGGTYSNNLLLNPFFAENPRYQAIFERVTYHQPVVITRWDSWRWWEALAAGCLAFHLDFEKYGFALPVMPKAWEHYIPIDLEDPKATVEKLMDQRPRWAEIAANGRTWARTHYSPEAVAQRMLDFAAQGVLFPD